MSRSALVTTRWSKTKPPLSPPATRRSAGSHLRRSGWVNICSARSSGGTAAGTQSQSASKWQSRVSVSRLAGSPQRGHSTSTKSGRSASGLPSPVGGDVARQDHRQVGLAGPAPGRSSGSGRSGSACPRSAGGRSRSRWRGSASPRARPRPAPRRPSALLGGGPGPATRSTAGGDRRASASSTAGMPSAAVGPKRASTSGETKTGSSLPPGPGDRCAGVDHRHRARRRGRCAPSRPSAARRAARGRRRRRPSARPRDGAARAGRSVRQADGARGAG